MRQGPRECSSNDLCPSQLLTLSSSITECATVLVLRTGRDTNMCIVLVHTEYVRVVVAAGDVHTDSCWVHPREIRLAIQA